MYVCIIALLTVLIKAKKKQKSENIEKLTINGLWSMMAVLQHQADLRLINIII